MAVPRSTYTGLCRLNQASLGFDSQLSRGNTVGHETQFGIIRKAALYAGFGPGTVDLFRRLWGMEAPPKVRDAQPQAQQCLLFTGFARLDMGNCPRFS
jgi:hypothetical protein